MPYINDVLAKNKQVNQENNVKQEQQKQKRMSRFLFEPDAVIEKIKKRIVGQEAMCNILSDILHIVKADFSPSHRPLSVCFMLGSTGVGKTETVRILGESILGSPDAICRIDMNTLAQEHYMAALTGAPPGYVGSKENHTLFDSDKIQGSYSKPGIVLFDEVEKASDEVIRSLLNVLDNGFLKLPTGSKSIDFRNAMIFMTSNVGVRSLSAYRATFNQGLKKWLATKPNKGVENRLLDKALCQRFDPEFINRIDHIITFRSIDNQSLSSIFDLQIEAINQRLLKKEIRLVVNQQAKDFILQSYDARYGARDIARHINQLLNPELARMINNDFNGESLSVTIKNNNLYIA